MPCVHVILRNSDERLGSLSGEVCPDTAYKNSAFTTQVLESQPLTSKMHFSTSRKQQRKVTPTRLLENAHESAGLEAKTQQTVIQCPQGCIPVDKKFSQNKINLIPSLGIFSLILWLSSASSRGQTYVEDVA